MIKSRQRLKRIKAVEDEMRVEDGIDVDLFDGPPSEQPNALRQPPVLTSPPLNDNSTDMTENKSPPESGGLTPDPLEEEEKMEDVEVPKKKNKKDKKRKPRPSKIRTKQPNKDEDDEYKPGSSCSDTICKNHNSVLHRNHYLRNGKAFKRSSPPGSTVIINNCINTPIIIDDDDPSPPTNNSTGKFVDFLSSPSSDLIQTSEPTFLDNSTTGESVEDSTPVGIAPECIDLVSYSSEPVFTTASLPFDNTRDVFLRDDYPLHHIPY